MPMHLPRFALHSHAYKVWVEYVSPVVDGSAWQCACADVALLPRPSFGAQWPAQQLANAKRKAHHKQSCSQDTYQLSQEKNEKVKQTTFLCATLLEFADWVDIRPEPRRLCTAAMRGLLLLRSGTAVASGRWHPAARAFSTEQLPGTEDLPPPSGPLVGVKVAFMGAAGMHGCCAAAGHTQAAGLPAARLTAQHCSR